jgi:hypothetical protein
MDMEFEMRKMVILSLLAILAAGQTVFAEDAAEKAALFGVDLGGGISFGMLKDTGSEDALAGLATFLATLRGAAYGSLRFNVIDMLSVGAQLGVYAISYESGTDSVTLVDLPVHALVRLDLDWIAVEGFAGYYLSMIQGPDYNFGGLEFGAKAFLGNLYASYSMVMANPSYTRIEAGIQLTNFFKF